MKKKSVRYVRGLKFRRNKILGLGLKWRGNCGGVVFGGKGESCDWWGKGRGGGGACEVENGMMARGEKKELIIVPKHVPVSRQEILLFSDLDNKSQYEI